MNTMHGWQGVKDAALRAHWTIRPLMAKYEHRRNLYQRTIDDARLAGGKRRTAAEEARIAGLVRLRQECDGMLMDLTNLADNAAREAGQEARLAGEAFESNPFANGAAEGEYINIRFWRSWNAGWVIWMDTMRGATPEVESLAEATLRARAILKDGATEGYTAGKLTDEFPSLPMTSARAIVRSALDEMLSNAVAARDTEEAERREYERIFKCGGGRIGNP